LKVGDNIPFWYMAPLG